MGTNYGYGLARDSVGNIFNVGITAPTSTGPAFGRIQKFSASNGTWPSVYGVT